MKDKDGKDAPTFWSEQTEDSRDQVNRDDNLEKRKKDIETFVDLMMSTSPTDIKCDAHVNCNEKIENCPECQLLVDKVSKYQKHNHTFTCKKKGKTINIKYNEGHGIDDGIKTGPEFRNVPICRFNIPKYPSDKTKFILGTSKDIDPEILESRKKDLRKITKYLIRQTSCEFNLEESESWKKMKQMSFLEFLYQVGMFTERKKIIFLFRKRDK